VSSFCMWHQVTRLVSPLAWFLSRRGRPFGAVLFCLLGASCDKCSCTFEYSQNGGYKVGVTCTSDLVVPPESLVVGQRRALHRSGASLQSLVTSATSADINTLTAFRITDLQIRDPHLFKSILSVCTEVTGSVNSEIHDRFALDSDQDGHKDADALIVFRNLNLSGPGDVYQLVSAKCDTLADPTCTLDTVSPEINLAFSYVHNPQDTCLSPDPLLLHPYTPAVVSPIANCFGTLPINIEVTFGGTTFTMYGAEMGATFVDNPPTSLVRGLMRAFLAETTATRVLLPADAPLVGGQPLASLFAGGPGSCPSWSDQDIGPDGVTVGWWIFANFEATRVNLLPPLAVPRVESQTTLGLRAYPNPSLGGVQLSYVLPTRGSTSLSILDLAGREVATLLDKDMDAGRHITYWNGRSSGGAPMPPGAYIARVSSPAGSSTTRILLLGTTR